MFVPVSVPVPLPDKKNSCTVIDTHAITHKYRL